MQISEIKVKDLIDEGNELNLTIPSGEAIVLTGENGSGKTSILRSIFAAVNGDHYYLMNAPYSQLTVVFTTGENFTIYPRPYKKSTNRSSRNDSKDFIWAGYRAEFQDLDYVNELKEYELNRENIEKKSEDELKRLKREYSEGGIEYEVKRRELQNSISRENSQVTRPVLKTYFYKITDRNILDLEAPTLERLINSKTDIFNMLRILRNEELSEVIFGTKVPKSVLHSLNRSVHKNANIFDTSSIEEFQELIKSVLRVNYIPAQRNMSFLVPEKNNFSTHGGLQINPITNERKKIKNALQKTSENSVKKFSEYSQSLFNKLISGPIREQQELITDKKLSENVELYLKTVGLAKEINLYEFTELENNLINLANDYKSDRKYNSSIPKNVFLDLIRAHRESLLSNDEMIGKFSLFKNFVEKKITDKEIKFSEDFGFSLLKRKGENSLNIMPEELSSGEQHLVILASKIIFYDNLESSNSILKVVLIDEPEISLHIFWQEDLLLDLLTLAKTENAQLIVATHSPTIIAAAPELEYSLDS